MYSLATLMHWNHVTYLICVISYGNVIGGLVNVLISRHKGIYLSDWLLATQNKLIIEIV